MTFMWVGNPLLRKGGSQTLRQTFLCLLRIPQAALRNKPRLGQRGGLRNPQNETKVLGRGIQSERVSDPAEPGLHSAKRGGEHPFPKGWPQHHPTKLSCTHSSPRLFKPGRKM